MIYSEVNKNIVSLLQSTGPLKREQLIRMFSDEIPPSHVEIVLKKMVLYADLKYDEANDTYAFHADDASKISAVQKRNIAAFWVIAYVGSRNVRQIIPGLFPTQYIFSAKTDETESLDAALYDITVVLNETDAAEALAGRVAYRIKDEKDVCCHIAVVYSKEMAAKAILYGFDSYCVLDPDTGEPYYDFFESNGSA